jgi:MoaA/NifB/PqqE/SkfB family radical SAM enzyme
MDIQVTTPTSRLLSHRRIHIELSSKCTLKCPRCPRTELHPDSLNKEITLLEFQRAFTPDLLKEIQEITFCGDIGDPIYARDFLPIVEYIKRSRFNVSLVIVTNGSYKPESWWQELGMYLRPNDKVTFSVDGWDQASNEQYRVNSDFDSIVAGARALRRVTKAQMNWSAIYFRFNEDKMPWIQDLARELGFDTFEAVLSTKFDNQYLVNGVDPLKPLGGWVATGKYEVMQEKLKSGITVIFYETRQRHSWARCANWDIPMFVNVDGYVFPCPWFNSGYLENDFFEKHREQLSIKHRTLKEIIDDPLWDEMYTRFEIAPLDICKLKCKNAQ